MEKSMTKVCE